MKEKSQAWNFTYFGGTVSQRSGESRTNLAPESTQNQLMSFTVGSEVQVTSKTTSGSIVVCIQDKQIGLGAEMANQVMVTLVIDSKL